MKVINTIEFLNDSRISRSGFLLIIFLMLHGGQWCFGQKKISSELGLDIQTINRGIAKLESLGYLEKRKGRDTRMKNIYLMTTTMKQNE